MKKVTIIMISSILIWWLLISSSAMAYMNKFSKQVKWNTSSISRAYNNYTTWTLQEIEKNDLLFMYEEEKLARDVYNYLYSKYSLPIFSNIAKSEQTHMNSISGLLTKYSVTNTANSNPWIYTNIDLQNLYNSLIKEWDISIKNALSVWKTIEEVDIKDLSEKISDTKLSDLIRVYTNLKNWSYNHLRAFEKQLVNY